MTEYYKEVYGYINSKINDPETAKDMTQDVFLKYSALDTNPGKPYLFTISKNLVIDHYRKNKRLLIENESLENGHDEKLQCELDECLAAYISNMEEPLREQLILSDFKGVNQKEIAAKYGINYSSLRSNIQRGRKKLKSMFEKNCHIEQAPTGRIISCQPKK